MARPGVGIAQLPPGCTPRRAAGATAAPSSPRRSPLPTLLRLPLLRPHALLGFITGIGRSTGWCGGRRRRQLRRTELHALPGRCTGWCGGRRCYRPHRLLSPRTHRAARSHGLVVAPGHWRRPRCPTRSDGRLRDVPWEGRCWGPTCPPRVSPSVVRLSRSCPGHLGCLWGLGAATSLRPAGHLISWTGREAELSCCPGYAQSC
jgi:hypothetical protein